ncbi:MAG: ATP-binding protein [Planctomycetota bacterium]
MSRVGLALFLAAAVLCIALAATGAVTLLEPTLEGLPSSTRMVAHGVAVGLPSAVCLALLVGVGVAQVRRLGERMQACGHNEAPESGLRAPGWLGPVAEAYDDAAHDWADRLGTLNTRLREVEIRHRLSEAERDHAEAILNSLRDAVIVTDGFNELTTANDRAGALLGFDARGAQHQPIDELIDDKRLREMIQEVRSAGVASKQKHVEHTMPSSGATSSSGESAAAFDVTLTCLPDGNDGVGGVVTILRDITREREISQMKSDFVSQASHELRTPLSSINAYVEMLLDAEAQDEASRQEFYQIIKAEADRVSRMIDNMLNISRIEAGIHSVEHTEVDFVAVCRDVVEAVQPQAKAKDIMLSVKSGPLVYTAQADRDMIHQVVMNLVSNGIKYTPEGGRVTVSVENDDTTRSVMVTVADTGLGIPPDALSRIFDKFFRIENYKRVAKGTGLGLNLVKHIVETVHKGTIHVSSEMGMGSRFWFTIPYEAPGSS